jgi:hypothetical protein
MGFLPLRDNRAAWHMIYAHSEAETVIEAIDRRNGCVPYCSGMAASAELRQRSLVLLAHAKRVRADAEAARLRAMACKAFAIGACLAAAARTVVAAVATGADRTF